LLAGLASLCHPPATEAKPGDASPDGFWIEQTPQPAARAGRQPHTKANSYRAFRVNFAKLRTEFAKAPRIGALTAQPQPVIVTIPTPTGTFARFQIEESPLFSAEMAQQHPGYTSYSGRGLDDLAATIRISVTPNGLYAQVLSPGKIFYVDPFDASDTEFCVSYFRSDARPQARFQCGTEPMAEQLQQQAVMAEKARDAGGATAQFTSGSTQRTYRMVVMATGEYTQYQNANGPGVVTAIYSAMERVTGIYRSELSLGFSVVGIYFYNDPNTDPYDETNTTQCLNANQTTVDSLVGDANYDIGHLFGVNISSAATMGGVCQSGLKAKGATGRNPPVGDPFVVDYVAHEIGHQFGANHTFNSTSGACSQSTRTPSSAYERGSGTTIMGYANICPPDDTQTNSDPYFHVRSLEQIKNYTTPGVGLGDCPPGISTGNTIPSVNAGPNYTIPKLTPFKLTGSGSDVESAAVSFCWEQRDLGPEQSLAAGDNGASPLFRSRSPVDGTSARIFPRFAEQGTNSDPLFHEVLPSFARVMNFRLTVRDQAPVGAFATDDMTVTVNASAGPFALTSPNSSAVVWTENYHEIVTWSVNGTDQAPINCATVEIRLSIDNGQTYPIVLSANEPNDGAAEIVVPGLASNAAQCRVMIRAAGNIFFDVSDAPFPVFVDSTLPTITFSPLTNQQVVFNFDQLGGTISEAGTVQFKIEEFNGGTHRYWTGSAWINDANSPSVLLNANVAGLAWTPAATLPTRGQIAYQLFLIHAYVIDLAGNSNYNSLVISRSPSDTTPPLVSINISEGREFTNNFLPPIAGLAADPETGADLVTMYFTRLVPGGGYEYWTGAGWTGTGTALTMNLQSSPLWQMAGAVAQPSGANLRNGSYTIEIVARNREVPPVSGAMSVNFTVDYHPVYTWTGGSFSDGNPNNNDHLWDNAANWDTGVVPPASAVVIISSGTPDSTAMGAFDIYGVDLFGGTLTSSGISIKKLNLTGGTLAGTNTITANGSFNWSGGTVSATVGIPSSAAFNISGGAIKVLAGNSVINTAGNTTWTDAGLVYAAVNSVVNNTGSFVAKNDSQFYNYSGGTPVPVFINSGSFTKTNSVGTTAFATINGGVAFNNTGSVNVQSGSLSLGGGGTSANETFVAAAGSSVDLVGGNFFFNGNATFAGAGTNRINGGSATFSGGTNTLSGGTFELSAGTLGGTNTFSGAGIFSWSGGTISGLLNLPASFAFNISGAAIKVLSPNNVINTAGNATWTDAGLVYAAFNSVLNNTGSFVAQNDSQFYNYSGGTPVPVFINSGSFTKTNSVGTTAFATINGGVAFNNTGTVNVQSGVLSLGGGGTSANGIVAIAAGSLVDLVTGDFYFNGNTTFGGTGTNRISGASATFNGTNTLSGGTFELSAGTQDGTNTFSGAGIFGWSGGTISGLLNLPASFAFNLSGGAGKVLAPNSVINTAGNATWTDAGLVYAAFNSVLNNTGNFVAQNDSQFYNYSGGTPVPVFINSGSFTKTNSVGTTAFATLNGGVAFNNTGSVNVQSGSLSLGGGGTSANETFVAAAGSSVDLVGGNFFFNGNATFAGAGTNRINGGSATFSGGTNTLSGGTFELSAGTLGGTNTFSGAGIFSWKGGAISGLLNLPASFAFNISGAAIKVLAPNSVINTAGNATWTDAGLVYAAFNSVLNNTGNFVAQNDSQFYNYSGGTPVPVFINSGTFRKTGATGTTTFSSVNGGVAFDNHGIVDLRTGVLSLGGGYTASATSQLKLALGGLAPGTQFSQLTIGGAVAFAGTLGVSLTNGFSPTNGHSFALVNYGSRTSQFSAQQLPPLPPEFQWSVSYGATALTLTVTRPHRVSSPVKLANGHFQFTLSGLPATRAIIDASEHLSGWVPIRTNAPFNGTFLFDDPDAVNYTNRFYRIRVEP